VVKATPANIVPAKTSSPNVVPTSNTKTTTNNRLRPVQLEEGVKRISQESIENIRSDGNVFNINVDDKPTGTKSHLPGSPQESKYSPTKQVGVIRPISREAQDAGPMPKVKKILSENKTKTNSVLVSNLNKVNNNRSEENRDPSKDSVVIEKAKETLVIEKDPVFVPVESWLANPQKRPTGVDARPRGDNVKPATISLSSSSSPTSTTTLSSSSTTVVPSKAPTAPPAVSKAAAPTSGTGSVPISPHAPVLERLQPVSSSAPSRQPPSVPPRNGSRLEHSSPANNPTTISSTPTTLSQPVIPPVVSSKKEESVDVPDKGSSSYREAWKASKSEQNSLVFNFVGAKKDVSHIENDGLDLSSRAKSQGKGVILLDPGESNDGEEDEVGNDLKLNVTWVGAEVSTGKSSLRSKNNSKKLNISFNDKTEVFEYPSFEPVSPVQTMDMVQSSEEEPDVVSRLKSNTPVGSSGGLGSYTPSKIHLSDSPFQLGVSRSSQPNNPLATTSTSSSSNQSSSTSANSSTPALVPADHGVSWGRAASSDMLF